MIKSQSLAGTSLLGCGTYCKTKTYNGFEHALQTANILKPTDQFTKITKQFAVKSSKHPKFTMWFVPKPDNSMSTRSKKPRFIPVPTRTNRHARSPIPQLTTIPKGRVS